jgi:hypothetical protein
MQVRPFELLSSHEAMILMCIANGSDEIGSTDTDEGTVTRLHLLGLVEQRGTAMGLTAMGIHQVARIRQS